MSIEAARNFGSKVANDEEVGVYIYVDCYFHCRRLLRLTSAHWSHLSGCPKDGNVQSPLGNQQDVCCPLSISFALATSKVQGPEGLR